MTAPSPEPILEQLQKKYGGTIDKAYLRSATVADQECAIYIGGKDQVVVDGTIGRYTPQQLGLFVNIGLGRDLPVYAARAATQDNGAAIRAANDNKPDSLNINDWKSTRFAGEPNPVEYLVRGVIPMGVPGMVAAMGGAGKSFSLLELHRRVSFGGSTLASPIFGGQVAREGTTVMITSEDDEGEVHRRLDALDPKQERLSAKGERLIVVPLPSAGGPMVLWKQDKSGLVETDAFRRLQGQLSEIPDLALLTIDPLASFAHVAINEDPMAGQFVCTSMAALAAQTGATVLAAHHMRKPMKAVSTLAEAREAIRGSTALVDGLRLAYAMWPAEEEKAKHVCKELSISYEPDKVVFGGLVKKNGPMRTVLSTYVRNDFGLLVDRTMRLGTSAPAQGDLLIALTMAVETAAADGQPFTKTGETGLFKQKTRLPGELAALSRAKLEGLVDTALERKDIVAAIAKGSSTVKWLDVPGGQFAIGLGEFRQGMAR